MTPKRSPRVRGARVTPISVHFDGMSWPRAIIDDDDGCTLEWRLRYGANPPSREDVLMAATYIAAYRALVWKTTRQRDVVVRELRNAEQPRRASQRAGKRKGRK
jgi:hypothetical protein